MKKLLFILFIFHIIIFAKFGYSTTSPSLNHVYQPADVVIDALEIGFGKTPISDKVKKKLSLIKRQSAIIDYKHTSERRVHTYGLEDGKNLIVTFMRVGQNWIVNSVIYNNKERSGRKKQILPLTDEGIDFASFLDSWNQTQGLPKINRLLNKGSSIGGIFLEKNGVINELIFHLKYIDPEGNRYHGWSIVDFSENQLSEVNKTESHRGQDLRKSKSINIKNIAPPLEVMQSVATSNQTLPIISKLVCHKKKNRFFRIVAYGKNLPPSGSLVHIMDLENKKLVLNATINRNFQVKTTNCNFFKYAINNKLLSVDLTGFKNEIKNVKFGNTSKPYFDFMY